MVESITAMNQNAMAERIANLEAKITRLEEKVHGTEESTNKSSGFSYEAGWEKDGNKDKHKNKKISSSEKFEDHQFDGSNIDEDLADRFHDDTYAFISLHGPLENPYFFFFGLGVFLIQTTFLLLMSLNILVPDLRSDIGDDGSHPFIPANVEVLVKVAQVLATISFVLFADSTIEDIILGVQLMPNYRLSSTMRLFQGLAATLVAFFLIIEADDVEEVVLNFAAINFISSLDDVAFELALKGNYGKALEEEAKRISNTKMNITRKTKVNSKLVPVFVLLGLLVGTTLVTVLQSSQKYLTQRFRVNIAEESNFMHYSGCYDISNDGRGLTGRPNYKLFDEENESTTKFAYCGGQANKWVIFDDTSLDACDALEKKLGIIGYSSRSFAYDIKQTFGDPWFVDGGKDLDVSFFSTADQWTDLDCAASFADGKCYETFNTQKYNYDGGDCCGSTCLHGNCGLATITEAFGTQLTKMGDGFQNCKNPEMRTLIIQVDEISCEDGDFFPTLRVECDERSYLAVNLQTGMEKKTETVKVADGLRCRVILAPNACNATVTFKHQYIHDEIFILTGEIKSAINFPSALQFEEEFNMVPKCYFDKLSDHIDLQSMYNNTTIQSKAVFWLIDNDGRYSECSDRFFIERYALVALTFASNASPETQLQSKRNLHHCTWEGVVCRGGHVVNLKYIDVGDTLNKAIETEIGLLPQLDAISYQKTELKGTLPSEIGNLSGLRWINLYDNTFTGNIPTELGKLSNVIRIYLGRNNLIGTIPTELGNLTNLYRLGLSENNLTGTIPKEFANLKNLEILYVGNTSLTGSVDFCESLKNLKIYTHGTDITCRCCDDSPVNELSD